MYVASVIPWSPIMRWFIAALLITTAAAQAPARAQTPLTGMTGAPPAAPAEQTAPLSAPAARSAAPSGAGASTGHRTRRTLQMRFDEANSTHDGHLTAEQARAKMPSVARDFDAIDTDHKGYVTLDQIKAHTRAVRAAKRAAKEQHS
jgi:hypothetical protein